MSGTRHDGDHPAFALVAIGMSAGGLPALRSIVCNVPSAFTGALVIAQHVADATVLPELITSWTFGRHRGIEASDGALLEAGNIYVCPAQHHIVINADATLGISTKERVEFVRPSVDWLFETAAVSFGPRSIAVVLSGSNADGARGAVAVARAGGTVIVQDPADSQYPAMPIATLQAAASVCAYRTSELADAILASLQRIAPESVHDWQEPFSLATT